MSALELTPDQTAAVLASGELEILGRLRYSSNGAFLVEARADGVVLPAVFKPRRGERPLWDFADGTLCQREVATYELSRALGWDIVPVTVLRDDASFGTGAVQRFVDHDPNEHYFTLFEHHRERMLQFAVFDVLINNADRKAGHCLHDRASGVIVGIDHGLTFHATWKLRTVIWDFANEHLAPVLIHDVRRLVHDLETSGGELASRLAPLISPDELGALRVRATELVRTGRLPNPEPGYHAVPWPLV